MTDYRYVVEHTSRRTRLEQLAEEAAELSQAALKLIRAMGYENPTPVSEIDAWHNLDEEYLDLVLAYGVAIEAREELFDAETFPKLKRWADRLKAAEDDECFE